jgi:nicotinamide-nucleotide amidase
MATRVLPYLREKMGSSTEIIKSLTLRTSGIGESQVGETISALMSASNPTVGTAAHVGQTDVRITAKGSSEDEADRLIAQVAAEVRRLLGDHIYGEDKETVEEVTVQLLQEAGLKLAILETNSGGEIAAAVRQAPGGEETLVAAEVVADLEQLPHRPQDDGSLIWESPDLAQGLAADLQERTGADLAIALVGSTEPVDYYAARKTGTHVGLATPQGIEHHRLSFGGSSELSRRWTVMQGLNLVRLYLVRTSPPRQRAGL